MRNIVKDNNVVLKPENLSNLRKRMAFIEGKLDSNLENLKKDRTEYSKEK